MVVRVDRLLMDQKPEETIIQTIIITIIQTKNHHKERSTVCNDEGGKHKL